LSFFGVTRAKTTGKVEFNFLKLVELLQDRRYSAITQLIFRLRSIELDMGNFHSLPVTAHVMSCLEALEEENTLHDDGNTPRARNRHRNRGYALNEVNNLSDDEFSSMFRMSRLGFNRLLDLVSPFLSETDVEMATISSGSAITKATKLFVTLRYLAGGSHLDLCFAWGISKSAFFSTDPCRGVIWPTIKAIDESFTIGLPVHDPVELERLSTEFAVYSHGEMTGCVTAIDGWVARTRKPTNSEVDEIVAYRNRHDCWGLVVLAGCDARCRFTMFSCKNCGSTNDAMAWDDAMPIHVVVRKHRSCIYNDIVIECHCKGDPCIINVFQLLIS